MVKKKKFRKDDGLWYIVPTRGLDMRKYRGRGRPRKSDYTVFTGKDFINWPVEIETKMGIVSFGS